jgi:hypothetical protein
MRLVSRKYPARAMFQDLLDRERLTLVASALLPILLVLVALAGVLWGSGHELEGVELPGRERTDTAGDQRGLAGELRGADGVAWGSLVLLCMLLAVGLLPLITSGLAWRMRGLAEGTLWRLRDRYGLELLGLWPHLVQVLPNESLALMRRRGRHVATRWGTCAGHLLTTMLGVLVLVLVVPTPGLLLGVVICVSSLLAAWSYSGLPGATAGYFEAVESAVDLHRFAVLRALHLPLPDNREDERAETWKWTAEGDRAPDPALPYILYDRPTEAGLPPQVAKALTEAFAEPPVVNYVGEVTAWIADDEDPQTPVAADDGCFVLEPAADYRLVIGIGRPVPSSGPRQSIDISDGITAAEAPFQISLDSGGVRLPPTTHELVVPTDGSFKTLDTRFMAPDRGDHRLFVYVLQRNQLLEVLELRATVVTRTTA